MGKQTFRQRYLAMGFERSPADDEMTKEDTWALAQQLGCPADAVQVIDLEDWRRQDETFGRETRRLVQRAKAMNAREKRQDD